MARMLPATLEDDHGSQAERRIFAALRDETPSSWRVVHSVGLAGHREKRWAEIDFVVVCEHGLFCLEVKGGVVERRAGEWFSNGHRLTESPFSQVGGAESALRAHLRMTHPDLLRGIVMGSAVVVPDAPFEKTMPEADPARIYDSRDVARPIADWVSDLAAHYAPYTSPKTRKTLSVAQVSQLVHAICPDFRLVPSMRAVVDRTDGEMVRLSEQQSRALQGLRGSPRVLVSGGAGTGKTLIASREAVRLAASNLRTTYVCFGKRLAESLRPGLEAAGVRVVHAHGLMGEVIERAGRAGDLPKHSQGTELFDVHMPTLAADCLIELEEHGSVDALVIDEAQDLLKAPTLDFLGLLLAGELTDGTWRMFLDPHQNIFGGDEGEVVDRLAVRSIPFALDQNCRNARPVAEAAARISGIAVSETLVNDGPPTIERWYADERGFSRELSSQTQEWLAAGVDAAEIVILSPRSFAKTHLPAAKLPRRVIDVSKGAAPQANCFRFSTIQGFKGLEADIVVLTGFEGYDRDGVERLLYIGATRAKSLLCTLFDHGMRGRIHGEVAGLS
jgi:hypothetical protein